jgi:catechol 2,3-dioxygenase-like lactoylglutathione lyase family enzyme
VLVRITHLDHVTVLITDLASAKKFYGQILGLREIPPPREFDFVAIWYDLGGQYLHLLQKPAADTPSPRHFCLHVDDIASARAHMAKSGIPIQETVKISAADRFFIQDPDGNRIEILHWQRPYQPESDGKDSKI